MSIAERIRRLKRYVVLRVLHADDTPHEIAAGAGIGLFIAMTPTIGIQMVLALLATTALRANKAIGVSMVWISNPLTMVPIFVGNWRIGRNLVQTVHVHELPDVEGRIKEIIASIGGLANLASHMFDGAFWSEVLRLIWSLGVELWIGSFIVGGVCAVVGYVVAYLGVRIYRQRFPRPRFKRRRTARQAGLRASRPRLQEDSA